MIFAVLFVGCIFLAIGLIMTEKNARYLLAGYNTMSEGERKNIDMQAYMPAFKKFHIILGVSMLVIGSLLYFFVSETSAGLFIGIFPLVAYLFFFTISRQYLTGAAKRKQLYGFIIIGAVLIFILGLMSIGRMENQVVITKDKIEFEGMYGEVIAASDIKSISLVPDLPEIKVKTNGFAAGSVRKGYFRTAGGEEVKLIINAENPPYLFITKNAGKKIYYATGKMSTDSLFNKMKMEIPGVDFQ